MTPHVAETSSSPPGRGVVLAPGEGRHIAGGSLDATVKMTLDHPALTSTFEVRIGPGFDVGAHLHDIGEEIFYLVEGELEMFAFEPVDRSIPDWHDWTSPSGERPRRVGPGAFMFVPTGTPHGFSNPTDNPAKVLFQSSVPGGHENYFDELIEILEAGHGKPDLARLADLRARYHIQELTTLR